MNEANLTRFGPETVVRASDGPVSFSANFRAMDGPARLALQNDGIDRAAIRINGHDVLDAQGHPARGETVVDVHLERDNTISISVPAGAPASLGIRVTQLARADIGIVQQGYFGLNTSDMERQRAFYELLGFKGEIYPAGPETSETFARSLGFEDDYLIHVSLHSLTDPPTMPFVDTVQFRGDSYRDEPPYAALNHIGMAYATYATSDLDGDHAYLQSRGVEFIAPPTTAPGGERFTFMKDQDGAFMKLIQGAGGEVGSPGPHLQKLVNTNMNVRDLERSREFYRLLGFTETVGDSQAGDGEFAAAYGFGEYIEFEGLDVSLGAGTDGATIQLRQWKTPYDDAPPYPPPVNHLGIDRINFYVKDLTAAVKMMNDLGFEQLGPIGGMPEIGIVFFFDPDGIKVQLAGPQNL